MKIAILTQTLRYNYGGILQNYALQKVLRDLGHDPTTIDRQNERSLLSRAAYYAWVPFRIYVQKKGRPITPPVSRRRFLRETAALRRFIKENIQVTDIIPNTKRLRNFDCSPYGCMIVGSDQVWLSKFGTSTFFGFVPENSGIKRYAYAASFGSAEWRFSKALTEECRRLAQKFNGISVRENSAVRLCREHLGVDAVHVLDPVFLLSPEDYNSLVESRPRRIDKFIMTYVLDSSGQKEETIRSVSEATGMRTVSYTTEPGKAVRPIEDWISGFRDAAFIITDSFHGTVLSILYNKPFITICNARRGADRFHSLLGLTGLEERLIEPYETGRAVELASREIDYDRVNTVLGQERAKSMDFLRKI